MLLRRTTNRREKKQSTGQQTPQPENIPGLKQPLAYDLNSNLVIVNQIMGHANDMIIRESFLLFFCSLSNPQKTITSVPRLHH